MRDQWYGDKRDVVKWGTLIHLARRHKIGRIVQVAYYRPTELEYTLDTDNADIPIDPAVIRHFHDIDDIQRLGKAAGIRIDVYKEIFNGDRAEYHDRLIQHLNRESEQQIVFLDPDTGLAPENYDYRHVRTDELKRVYGSLQKGDLLVFYQHKRLLRKNWLPQVWEEFLMALQVPQKSVEIVVGQRVASDIAFFIAQKTEAEDCE